MTRRNLILTVTGVGLVVFAVLGVSRYHDYSLPDRFLAAAGAVLIILGIINLRREPLALKTQLQGGGSRQDRSGNVPEDRWYRHKIVAADSERDIAFFAFVCLEEPYVNRPEAINCWDRPGDPILEALYRACGYLPRPEGRNPKCIVGCEVYARPVGPHGFKEFRPVNDPLPIR